MATLPISEKPVRKRPASSQSLPPEPESERMRKSIEDPVEKKSDGMGRMTYITAVRRGHQLL